MSSTSVQAWSRAAIAALPPEDAVIERNRAITAAYARWYREHPTLYKWAGAAAFASYRIGLALMPYRLTTKGEITSAEKEGNIEDPTLFADLDLLRQTNTAVYLDTAWLHLAFVDTAGGIDAVRAGLAGQTKFADVLAGFEAIEQGRAMLDASPPSSREAAAKIWEGNRSLLYHEQHNVIQPLIERMQPGFRIFMTVMTQIDFGMPDFRPHFSTYTAFQKFMALEGRGGARFTDFDDRWFWIENAVLKTWKRVDAEDEALTEKIDALIAAAS